MEAPRVVTLGHGSGGRLTHALVKEVFVARLRNPALSLLGDSALLGPVEGRLALTTDAFVVSPLFFPGGDIGTLAVYGTANDLAVAGAEPRWLSASFILEEGCPIRDLERVADSMAEAARRAGVQVVTGDTKVVEKGHGDGIFITTAGVGLLREPPPEGVASMRPGDLVLVTGPVGDHGAVIGALRSGLELDGLVSDCGPVGGLAGALREAGVRSRFQRDPTRGGLATVLAELGVEAGLSVFLDEDAVPVRPSVRGVCDILGLDPYYLACEGRMVAVVPQGQGERALSALRALPEGLGAAVIGEVREKAAGPVVLLTRYGGSRLYDTLASEQLPRIC